MAVDETHTTNEELAIIVKQQVKTLHNVERFVVTTIFFFAVVFLLTGIKKRYANIWLKLISYLSYISVPLFISYTFGLMDEYRRSEEANALTNFRILYGALAVFLLFPYGSFDNLTAFNLDEIKGRMRILFQFIGQISLFVLLVVAMYMKEAIYPVALVFLVVCLRLAERIIALAHAAGATSGIRGNLKKVINYINTNDDDQVDLGAADPLSMQGYKYLVGPRYSKTADGKIVDGVTLEKIWGCNGRLLSSKPGGGDSDGQLKDTCLSFALFWLLLGKIWGYPNLYVAGSKTSRMKAWKLVRDRLLPEQDKAFGVMEVELCFLRDFFYSKYMFFYLNGFYWKLISVASFPIMFWYFTRYIYVHYGFENLNLLYKEIGVDSHLNTRALAIVILVLGALELIQFFALITSRWCNVILLCHYISKREASQRKDGFFSRCFEAVIGAVVRLSLRTRAVMSKPWKRELGQYSLLESCTCFSVDNKPVVSLCDVFGVPLPKPSKKQGDSVALSEDVKRAVVASLQTNGPKLSNGVSSLKRNRVEETTIPWACQHTTVSETVLVWHIATSICEMNPASEDEDVEGFQIATELSKYCAYLLAFAPQLISVPALEAEVSCENAIEEARSLLKKPFSLCGKAEEVDKYKRLIDLLTSDVEVGDERVTTLQKGVKLGVFLNSIHDDVRRWKILAEFWAELMLFLAPCNNEMAHVEKLAEGGEFITHLWALLIHAGIVDRND